VTDTLIRTLCGNTVNELNCHIHGNNSVAALSYTISPSNFARHVTVLYACAYRLIIEIVLICA